MTQASVSIIIPSYNGKEKVMRLLRSLEKQSFSFFEVLVVIDGSTDGSTNAIQKEQWQLHSLKIIEQINQGRAGARNTGAAKATGDLFIFFDDDMVINPSCVEKHLAANDSALKRIVLGQVVEPSNASDNEIKKYKDFLNQSWFKKVASYKQQNLPTSFTYLSAQNFSISKNLFTELGGFNQQLKDVEDYDLAIRAKSNNIHIYYLDEAIAIHLDSFTFRKYAERSKAYLTNRLLAASFNPDLYKNDPILTHNHGVPLQILYSFLKYPFWFTILDSYNIFMYVVPKSIRYKLYGIIITAFVRSQQK